MGYNVRKISVDNNKLYICFGADYFGINGVRIRKNFQNTTYKINIPKKLTRCSSGGITLDSFLRGEQRHWYRICNVKLPFGTNGNWFREEDKGEPKYLVSIFLCCKTDLDSNYKNMVGIKFGILTNLNHTNYIFDIDNFTEVAKKIKIDSYGKVVLIDGKVVSNNNVSNETTDTTNSTQKPKTTKLTQTTGTTNSTQKPETTKLTQTTDTTNSTQKPETTGLSQDKVGTIQYDDNPNYTPQQKALVINFLKANVQLKESKKKNRNKNMLREETTAPAGQFNLVTAARDYAQKNTNITTWEQLLQLAIDWQKGLYDKANTAKQHMETSNNDYLQAQSAEKAAGERLNNAEDTITKANQGVTDSYNQRINMYNNPTSVGNAVDRFNAYPVSNAFLKYVNDDISNILLKLKNPIDNAKKTAKANNILSESLYDDNTEYMRTLINRINLLIKEANNSTQVSNTPNNSTQVSNATDVVQNNVSTQNTNTIQYIKSDSEQYLVSIIKNIKGFENATYDTLINGTYFKTIKDLNQLKALRDYLNKMLAANKKKLNQNSINANRDSGKVVRAQKANGTGNEALNITNLAASNFKGNKGARFNKFGGKTDAEDIYDTGYNNANTVLKNATTERDNINKELSGLQGVTKDKEITANNYKNEYEKLLQQAKDQSGELIQTDQEGTKESLEEVRSQFYDLLNRMKDVF